MDAKTELINELISLDSKLKSITKRLAYIENEWPNHFNENDPEDLYIRNKFASIENKLTDVRFDIKMLTAQVAAQGKLILNSDRRFKIEGTDYYFTSGSYIEVLYDGRWISGTIEHNGEDYYITSLKGVSLLGLTARVK